MVPHRAGVVLAGGYSRRFGEEDKALASIGGEPLLARVVRRLSPVVDEVVVSCRSEQVDRLRATLEASRQLRFAVDPIDDGGPLVGLRSATAATGAEHLAVVGCDMPFVDAPALEGLFARLRDRDAVVPVDRDGRRQPLHAVYQHEAVTAAVDGPAGSPDSLRALVDRLDAVETPLSGVDRRYWNVNTAGELQAARRVVLEVDAGQHSDVPRSQPG